jgi:phosphoglycolate phosphatase
MILKAVIFDLDGTLIDTTEEIGYIFNEFLYLNGFPKRDRQFYKTNIGNGVEDLLSKSLPEEYNGDFSSLLVQVKEIYAENLNQRSTVFDGMFDVLELLKTNQVDIGIITNKMHHLAVRCVDKFFQDYQIKTMGAEHLFPRKPNPESALAMASDFGHLPSEMLFIGDSSVDITTARNAGMIPIGVLWGNGTRSQLKNAGADILFETTKDLKKYIRRL